MYKEISIINQSNIDIKEQKNLLFKNEERYIKYFKAWNASFKFQGFNLDMNNELEYECVLNALFKTYGTKKKKSYEYLHSVHKDG